MTTNQKKQFEVTIVPQVYINLVVEANSVEEAIELAHEMYNNEEFDISPDNENLGFCELREEDSIAFDMEDEVLINYEGEIVG